MPDSWAVIIRHITAGGRFARWTPALAADTAGQSKPHCDAACWPSLIIIIISLIRTNAA